MFHLQSSGLLTYRSKLATQLFEQSANVLKVDRSYYADRLNIAQTMQIYFVYFYTGFDSESRFI